MKAQKLCIDCKWAEVKEHDREFEYLRCGRRKNPVNGIGLNYCLDERRYSGEIWPWAEKFCGPKGKWWEPKESE